MRLLSCCFFLCYFESEFAFSLGELTFQKADRNQRNPYLQFHCRAKMFYCSSSALCMLETKLCFILFKWKHTVCSRKIMAARYHVMKSVTSRLSLVLVRLRPDICVLLISSNSNAFLLFSAFFLLCDKFISFILISECINNRINCNHFSQFLISCTRAWIVNFYFFGGGGREREIWKWLPRAAHRVSVRSVVGWRERASRKHTKILRYEKHEN